MKATSTSVVLQIAIALLSGGGAISNAQSSTPAPSVAADNSSTQSSGGDSGEGDFWSPIADFFTLEVGTVFFWVLVGVGGLVCVLLCACSLCCKRCNGDEEGNPDIEDPAIAVIPAAAASSEGARAAEASHSETVVSAVSSRRVSNSERPRPSLRRPKDVARSEEERLRVVIADIVAGRERRNNAAGSSRRDNAAGSSRRTPMKHSSADSGGGAAIYALARGPAPEIEMQPPPVRHSESAPASYRHSGGETCHQGLRSASARNVRDGSAGARHSFHVSTYTKARSRPPMLRPVPRWQSEPQVDEKKESHASSFTVLSPKAFNSASKNAGAANGSQSNQGALRDANTSAGTGTKDVKKAYERVMRQKLESVLTDTTVNTTLVHGSEDAEPLRPHRREDARPLEAHGRKDAAPLQAHARTHVGVFRDRKGEDSGPSRPNRRERAARTAPVQAQDVPAHASRSSPASPVEPPPFMEHSGPPAYVTEKFKDSHRRSTPPSHSSRPQDVDREPKTPRHVAKPAPKARATNEPGVGFNRERRRPRRGSKFVVHAPNTPKPQKYLAKKSSSLNNLPTLSQDTGSRKSRRSPSNVAFDSAKMSSPPSFLAPNPKARSSRPPSTSNAADLLPASNPVLVPPTLISSTAEESTREHRSARERSVRSANRSRSNSKSGSHSRAHSRSHPTRRKPILTHEQYTQENERRARVASARALQLQRSGIKDEEERKQVERPPPPKTSDGQRRPSTHLSVASARQASSRGSEHRSRSVSKGSRSKPRSHSGGPSGRDHHSRSLPQHRSSSHGHGHAHNSRRRAMISHEHYSPAGEHADNGTHSKSMRGRARDTSHSHDGHVTTSKHRSQSQPHKYRARAARRGRLPSREQYAQVFEGETSSRSPQPHLALPRNRDNQPQNVRERRSEARRNSASSSRSRSRSRSPKSRPHVRAVDRSPMAKYRKHSRAADTDAEHVPRDERSVASPTAAPVHRELEWGHNRSRSQSKANSPAHAQARAQVRPSARQALAEGTNTTVRATPFAHAENSSKQSGARGPELKHPRHRSSSVTAASRTRAESSPPGQVQSPHQHPRRAKPGAGEDFGRSRSPVISFGSPSNAIASQGRRSSRLRLAEIERNAASPAAGRARGYTDTSAARGSGHHRRM